MDEEFSTVMPPRPSAKRLHRKSESSPEVLLQQQQLQQQQQRLKREMHLTRELIDFDLIKGYTSNRNSNRNSNSNSSSNRLASEKGPTCTNSAL